MLGIKKDNKHSYNDFGIKILSRSISIPSKRKIKDTVPFMNGSYDFSLLYGEQTYDEREITYTFSLPKKDKVKLNMLKIKIIEWLYDGIQSKLYDDQIPGFYFLAECTGIDYDESFYNYAQLTVSFTAYPFKISTLQDGHDIWNEFNFELDIGQNTKFNVIENESITLYNNSAVGVYPTIICDNNFEIIKNNITYRFVPGEMKSFDFKLDKGENNLLLKGNGTIEFKWFKEVL
ncbi:MULTISPECIES: phage tail domain-containing protein [Clostridium]|uniref:phage tail domain-containing protein n=1 Tax=Clostridium TaxID=1485 RepID=UPI0032F04C22